MMQRMGNPFFLTLYRHVWKALSSLSGSLLEVGRGDGLLPKSFEAYSDELVGLDAEPVAFEGHECSKVRVVTGDALDLPFEPDGFDPVVSIDVVEHIEEDFEVLEQCHRVPKPGGSLVVGTPDRGRISVVLQRLLGVSPVWPREYASDKVLGRIVHLREYEKGELCALAESVSFTDVSCTGAYLGMSLPGNHVIGTSYVPGVLSRFSIYNLLYAHEPRLCPAGYQTRISGE